MENLKVKRIMPLQTGVSERGEWKSREVVLEEIDERIQYPNQYVVRFTGDRVNQLDSIKEGDTVTCHWSSRVREFKTRDGRDVAVQENNGWGVKNL
ncbi:MAG: DUF3127 domain-containing protein [Prevotella sp.]|nr:DUF3127 domain-containing protein [Prevotella sp.]